MKHLLRLAFIVVTVLRFGLDEVALSVFPQPWVRLLVRLATLGRKLDRPRGERLLALVRNGGGLAGMVVARADQHAAELRRALAVAVLEHVAAAVDAGPD